MLNSLLAFFLAFHVSAAVKTSADCKTLLHPGEVERLEDRLQSLALAVAELKYNMNSKLTMAQESPIFRGSVEEFYVAINKIAKWEHAIKNIRERLKARQGDGVEDAIAELNYSYNSELSRMEWLMGVANKADGSGPFQVHNSGHPGLFLGPIPFQ